MNIRLFPIISLLAFVGMASPVCTAKRNAPPAIGGKEIFIPEVLDSLDLNDPASQWNFAHMRCSDNIALFWDSRFGESPLEAPDLDGQCMKVDVDRLLTRLETFYRAYYHDFGFVTPGQTKADRYRMMVMINYSLDKMAWGGQYDSTIGVLWVSPNRVQDKKLNCLAHELGHCFQMQIYCDDKGEIWGGNGFMEMVSQWMLWRMNAEWPDDETGHIKGFVRNTHKAFLHIDNIYHSPFVVQYWARKHGDRFIAQLFREGRYGEDPVTTYCRHFGMTQEQFNDEMYDAAAHIADWDLGWGRDVARRRAGRWKNHLVKTADGYWMPDSVHTPQNYGFNITELTVPEPGKAATVYFEGIDHTLDGYNVSEPEKAGWRYGMVSVNADSTVFYHPMHRDRKGNITYVNAGSDSPERLYLVVMGAPTEHEMLSENKIYDQAAEPDQMRQWPYRVRFSGTEPVTQE